MVRWSRGQEFAVEAVKIEQHTQARLQHYVKRVIEESVGGEVSERASTMSKLVAKAYHLTQ